jgi:hypothetical protein
MKSKDEFVVEFNLPKFPKLPSIVVLPLLTGTAAWAFDHNYNALGIAAITAAIVHTAQALWRLPSLR